MEKPTVTTYDWDHTDGQPADITRGMTIRQVLSMLREAGRDSFGDIGGARIYLSDGTWIEVSLTPTSGGAYLMSSQRITLRRWDNFLSELTIRRYDW